MKVEARLHRKPQWQLHTGINADTLLTLSVAHAIALCMKIMVFRVIVSPTHTEPVGRRGRKRGPGYGRRVHVAIQGSLSVERQPLPLPCGINAGIEKPASTEARLVVHIITRSQSVVKQRVCRRHTGNNGSATPFNTSAAEGLPFGA